MITGKSIAKGAVIVMAATLFSRFFGLLRDIVIARQFGMTGATDAYTAITPVVSGVGMAIAAAVSAGFIPVFNDYLVTGERENANKVANTLLNAAFIILLLIVAAAVFFVPAPALVRFFAPGFQGESVPLTAGLIRLMMPAIIFTGLMGLASGFLNSLRHFLVPALGPLVTSTVVIASAFLLGHSMGIAGLTLGTVAGFACQFLVQLPVMYRKGYRYKPELAVLHPGAVRVFKLMVPVLIASLVPALILLVERRLASYLATGSISALYYASRLVQLPQGLFVMAVSIPLFPAFSTFAAQKDYTRLKETMVKGVGALALIMIPASIGLIALDEPIVRLLFQRGAFEAKDTVPTAYAMAFYALALLPLAVRDVFRRGFYALQDTFTPVLITVLAAALNIVLDFVLVKEIGLRGLALGWAISALAEALVLYKLMNGRVNGLPVKSFVSMLLKVLAASLVMGVGAYFCSLLVGARINLGTNFGRLVQVGSSIVVGLLLYVAAIIVLRVREIREVMEMARGAYRKAAGGAR